MARNLQIPIYDSDDEISDNDLGLDSIIFFICSFNSLHLSLGLHRIYLNPFIESNVCNECIFCTREGIRHHKNKPNEISLIRRVRSPCRCFHECVTEGTVFYFFASHENIHTVSSVIPE